MSHISYDANGNATSFVGFDAVKLYQAAVIRSALGLLSKGIQPTRGYTMAKGLKAASTITGKTYKRGQVETAREDLAAFVENGKQNIPVVKEE